MDIFTTHAADCTPLQPCKSCRIAKFLRENLTEDAFAHFRALAEDRMTPSEILAQRITECDFSVRTKTALGDMRTVAELTKKTEAELLRLPNFARRGLNEVKEFLHANDLKLGS